MGSRCCDVTDINGAQDLSEELERICPVAECGDGELPDDGAVYIHQKSAFKLKYQFIKNTAVILDPRKVDFVFTYNVLDDDNTYVASGIQGNYTNCFINDSDKSVNIIFTKTGFPNGKLMSEYRFLIQDEYFIGGISNVYYGDWTGIKITDDLESVTKPAQFITKITQQEFDLSLIQTVS